ncbi:MAG: phytanoyl-CoA dioxygenase family protein [Polyangiaceae bacterium]|nr:phytanoyl-CoA dioxygenase family protein [Polyangiaceae bacterium]
MNTDSTLSSHLDHIERDGYTIVENAIEPSLLDSLTDELYRIERDEKIVPANNPFEGDRTVRIYNLLARGKVFEEIPVHPAVLPIVEKVLDRGCLVSSLSSIAIDPGQTAQPIHADDQVISIPKPHVPVICNTMWACTDFTEMNGATRVVPGSHKSERSPIPFEEVPSIPAEMKRGSVLIWHGSLWHGGGANHTQTRRLGIAMNYCAGYIRQQENQQLGIPLNVAKGFSDRLRKLCGFTVYKGLIGHIDKAAPTYLLDGTAPVPVVGVIKNR